MKDHVMAGFFDCPGCGEAISTMLERGDVFRQVSHRDGTASFWHGDNLVHRCDQAASRLWYRLSIGGVPPSRRSTSE
ncbi:MAG TPA: hypothetical protein VKJ07_24445 [Mycobacteriales bacterium]|nr:hypothetical protein [Mycobacteriales bacterium]